MQGFLKSKLADKLRIHLDNMKKESQEAWRKLMEIHKTGIVSVLGEEEKDEENLAEEESYEEVKVPLVKRMPSISAKSYF